MGTPAQIARLPSSCPGERSCSGAEPPVTSPFSPSMGAWCTQLPVQGQLAPGGSGGGWQEGLGGHASPGEHKAPAAAQLGKAPAQGPVSGHPALVAASRQASASFLEAKQRWSMFLGAAQAPATLQ